MDINNSIMIIGSRDVGREQARTLFELHLASFLDQGRNWILGGARGVDQWALEWLAENSQACWIVVPYTRAKQPKWLHPWFDEVEKVIELQLPKRRNAYAIRNRHMVDLSAVVVAIWAGKSGGTIKVLKYALRQRREVHAFPV